MEASHIPNKGPHLVGVRELRQNLSKYLRRVKAGETLSVTEHGEQVAVLAPTAEHRSPLGRLIAEGKVTLAKSDLTEYLKRRKPLKAAPGSPSTQELLDEAREDII